MKPLPHRYEVRLPEARHGEGEKACLIPASLAVPIHLVPEIVENA
jgi:hypothetical protein